jgi:hypothetical protein
MSKRSSLFASRINDEEKTFIRLTLRVNVIKLFTPLLMLLANKLDRLFCASLFSLV